MLVHKSEYQNENNILSKKDDVKIVVPSLAEILIPLGLPDQINEREECQLPQTDPISEEGGSYRHVRVQQKRKSHLLEVTISG